MSNPYNLDPDYFKKIKEKFNLKKELASARGDQLFAVFNEDLSEEERFALQFLYAYMPLSDLADYEGSLFLNHVRKTIENRNKVPWGKDIPDHLFLHFVLPYRISNENMEDYRGVLFDELFDRVKDMSMYDAINEVNHWSHEKATYATTDSRTSSPLTVMRTALGRCGEEAVFVVSALRSLSIPARQVYTPRWAHGDDNHAWVEGWADGNWYFFGACEPEARLNKGWFSGPARRAMLVNTRVSANYPGPEEITLAHPWFTEINLMDNYASNKTVTIGVKDTIGQPVVGAKVSFKVFNFSEFSTIVDKITDSSGQVSLTTGLGDLYIHVASDDAWGFKKVSVKDEEYSEIVITSGLPEDGIIDLDMVPPPEIKEEESEKITPEQKENNDRRLKAEDKLRADFEATFVSQDEANQLAKELSLTSDTVWKVIKNARGNSHHILKFLKDESGKYGQWPLKLLDSLVDKDVTDTDKEVFMDHLTQSLTNIGHDENIFIKYILCPRIGWEKITAYKAFFITQFTDEEKKAFRKVPRNLIKWVENHIEVIEDYTHYKGAASPKGSFELGKADKRSRDVLFVAMARSFGIPSRLEPADKRPQFMMEGEWIDAEFGVKIIENVPKINKEKVTLGEIRLRKDETIKGSIEYFKNFTLGKFENNNFRTLDYYQSKFSRFEEGIEVLPGHYRLITGNRLPDGTALTRTTYFTVKPGEITEVDFNNRKDINNVEVLGSINESCNLTLINGVETKLEDLNKDKALIIAWLEPDREPTKHLIKELGEMQSDMNAWGGDICLMVGDDQLRSLDINKYEKLPKKTSFMIDKHYEIFNNITSNMSKEVKKDFPMVLIVDTNSNIRYVSTGYKIGTAEEVLKISHTI